MSAALRDKAKVQRGQAQVTRPEAGRDVDQQLRRVRGRISKRAGG